MQTNEDREGATRCLHSSWNHNIWHKFRRRGRSGRRTTMRRQRRTRTTPSREELDSGCKPARTGPGSASYDAGARGGGSRGAGVLNSVELPARLPASYWLPAELRPQFETSVQNLCETSGSTSGRNPGLRNTGHWSPTPAKTLKPKHILNPAKPRPAGAQAAPASGELPSELDKPPSRVAGRSRGLLEGDKSIDPPHGGSISPSSTGRRRRHLTGERTLPAAATRRGTCAHALYK